MERKLVWGQQQYHVVPGPIGLVGLKSGLGRRASWAVHGIVHGIGAWVVPGGVVT